MPRFFERTLKKGAAFAACLLILLSQVSCGGDGEKEKPAKDTNPVSFGPVSLDGLFADAAKGVFNSCPPAKEASPIEKERAKAAISYAEKAESFFFGDDVCARMPKTIAQATLRYKQTGAAPYLSEARPADDCMQKALSVDEGVFGSKTPELRSILKQLDMRRMALQQDYGVFYTYLLDIERNDGGDHARLAVDSIESGYANFEKDRNDFISLLELEADKALDVLLRPHPLRLQIHCANMLIRSLQQQGERLSQPFIDDQLIRSGLEKMEKDLFIASSFPFPLSGEAEMAYRRFLKEVEASIEAFKGFLGKEEGRQERHLLNDSWRKAVTLHGEFLDLADKVAANSSPNPKNQDDSRLSLDKQARTQPPQKKPVDDVKGQESQQPSAESVQGKQAPMEPAK